MTGVAAVSAFIALLPIAPGHDGGLVLALPGLAALTFAAAFYMPALTVQAYATLLWPMVGVAIALDFHRRTRAGSGEPQP